MKYSARAALAVALCTAAWACGSSGPTNELVDARRAYEQAQVSPASEYTPDELLAARQALDRAEAAYQDDPGSAEEAHLAYLAARRAQVAEARGEMVQAKRLEAKNQAMYQQQLEQTAQQSQGALEGEQAARMDAEARAAAAMQSLNEVGSLSKDLRGLVLTLSGAVLFPSGGDTLSEPAKQSLDKVVSALQQQSPDIAIKIEGHADSTGETEMNEELSQRRAEAVGEYLTSRGIDSSRVEMIGRGEETPIASNDTSEGRATNRRVEIVLSPQATGTTMGAAPAPSPGGAAAKTLPEEKETEQPKPEKQPQQQGAPAPEPIEEEEEMP